VKNSLSLYIIYITFVIWMTKLGSLQNPRDQVV